MNVRKGLIIFRVFTLTIGKVHGVEIGLAFCGVVEAHLSFGGMDLGCSFIISFAVKVNYLSLIHI